MEHEITEDQRILKAQELNELRVLFRVKCVWDHTLMEC